jgi:hypothetical protein
MSTEISVSRALPNTPLQSGAMDPPNSPPLVVAPARYVRLPLASLITGFSVKAMQSKIKRGDWAEGKVCRHAPDGCILIDLQGYQRWLDSR